MALLDTLLLLCCHRQTRTPRRKIPFLLTDDCEQSTLFPETICKAGWNKERAIEAIFQKAGYSSPRKKWSDNPSTPSVATPTQSERKSRVFPTPTAAVVADPASLGDPVDSRTAVMLRFETVSFRMGFGKYIAKKRLKGG